ncbi:MAG: ATP-binding protein [Candidatus Njordarchaeales archaeon]
MEDQNPWWVNEVHDKYIEWKESEIKWMPSFVELVEVEPFSLNFVIGPRQIGKTTAIMVFIHDVLLRRRDPRSIFYYPCDEVVDYEELGEILDDYYNYKQSVRIKSSVIFLDEITFVDEWWRTIKARIDAGRFKNDVIFISGSASIELIAGKERFPGRRGNGKDYYLLPLTFQEYSRLVKKRPLVLQDFSPISIDNLLSANKVFRKDIREDFEEYLITGGFPLSIKEYLAKGRVSSAHKIYLDWLISDIVRAGKNDRLVKDILSQVICARLNPVSWNSLAKEVGGVSPHTIRNYIDFLQKLFIVKVLEFVDPGGKVIHRKNKKIHIIDPFLYDTVARWTRENATTEQKVESTVMFHLSFFGETYYWRNSTEIDIVLKRDQDLLGFEVKWGLKPTARKRPIKTIILDRDRIPLFLASLKIRSTYKVG